MPLVVYTDAALAHILGVSRQAVSKAATDGKIARRADGGWDVFAALQQWRAGTWAALQRPERGPFRPWLDPMTPLTLVIAAEVRRRARAEGAREEYLLDEEDDLEDEFLDEGDEG